MGKITSLNNERVRRAQALQRGARRRDREGVLAVEGTRLAVEALHWGGEVREAFYTPAFAATTTGEQVLTELTERRVPCWETSDAVFATLADTQTPQGILLVLPFPEVPLPSHPTLVLIPDGVRDPGNLGTMLRTAWASGVSAVLLPPGTVNVYNAKVVRAGMGAHFHVPMRSATWPEIGVMVAGTQVWLAEAGCGQRYDGVDWRAPTTVIMGGEAQGAASEARALAGAQRVYIPMVAGVESLNVSVATAVLLFEAARQRRRDM
ncbi:MAG TPA: RNA methyltransferase [Anaerolineae bacterium]|nr:RNA methyltransferase [Anaerolineae bacterium]